MKEEKNGFKNNYETKAPHICSKNGVKANALFKKHRHRDE